MTEPEPMANAVQLTEAERAALAILVTREIQRLQRIDREAGYSDHGDGNTMRPIMSELEYKLRAARACRICEVGERIWRRWEKGEAPIPFAILKLYLTETGGTFIREEWE